MQSLVERRKDQLFPFDAHRELIYHERLHWFAFFQMRDRIEDIDLLGKLESFDFQFESGFWMFVSVFMEHFNLVFRSVISLWLFIHSSGGFPHLQKVKY